jgi:FGGY family of carbohydrate kinases, C-terminal domain
VKDRVLGTLLIRLLSVLWRIGRPVPTAHPSPPGLLIHAHTHTVGQVAFEAGEAKNTFGTGRFLMMNTRTTLVPSHHGLRSTIFYKVDEQAVYALKGNISHSGLTIQRLRDQLQMIATCPFQRPSRVRATAASTSSRPLPSCWHHTGGLTLGDASWGSRLPKQASHHLGRIGGCRLQVRELLCRPQGGWVRHAQ